LIYDLVKECVKGGLQQIFHEGFHPPDVPPRAMYTDRVREAATTYLRNHPTSPGVEEPFQFRDPDSAPLSKGTVQPGFKAVPSATREEGVGLSGLLEEACPLGQIFSTYILARIHGELWIIDQHAAHERVLYERFLTAIQESQIPVQRMLIPQTLELTKAQMMMVGERLDQLEFLGLEVESFGSQSLVIRAVPAFLAKADLQGLVVDLIEDWNSMEKTLSAEDRRKALVATMACHGAIKANDGLTIPEMEALLKDILQLPMVMTCPHGRPLRVKFSRKELEAMLYR
jgi:DNA mismatch repair protein MutL